MTDVTIVKNSLTILIRRSPYGQIHAAKAIRHMDGALGDGIQTNVLLVDDGGYLAARGKPLTKPASHRSPSRWPRGSPKAPACTCTSRPYEPAGS